MVSVKNIHASAISLKIKDDIDLNFIELVMKNDKRS